MPLAPEELADAVRLSGTPLPAPGTGTGGAHITSSPTSPPPPPPPPPPLAELRGLTVRRGGRTVLDGVSLTVPEGDFLAVAGTNGAGKTTLLRALSGLVTPHEGEVVLPSVSPRPLTRLTNRQITDVIGFVFQNPEHQFVTGSVAEELAHGLRVRGTAREETEERVAAPLTRFGLTRYARTSPFLLSHGEKRRLSVASALITGPRLLVLDEPTIGQDRDRAAELLGLMARLREEGTTLVVVTHDLQLVADHAARLALLSGGRLLAQGTAHEVLCDDALVRSAGLRPPPVRRFAAHLAPSAPAWQQVCRLDDLTESRP